MQSGNRVWVKPGQRTDSVGLTARDGVHLQLLWVTNNTKWQYNSNLSISSPKHLLLFYLAFCQSCCSLSFSPTRSWIPFLSVSALLIPYPPVQWCLTLCAPLSPVISFYTTEFLLFSHSLSLSPSCIPSLLSPLFVYHFHLFNDV